MGQINRIGWQSVINRISKLIVQWGTVYINSSRMIVTLPITYSNTSYSAFVQWFQQNNDTGGGAYSTIVTWGSTSQYLSASSFAVSTPSSWKGFYYITIGY